MTIGADFIVCRVCLVGHVRRWMGAAVRNGAALYCSAAALYEGRDSIIGRSCGQRLRDLTPVEEAAWLVGGQAAVQQMLGLPVEDDMYAVDMGMHTP